MDNDYVTYKLLQAFSWLMSLLPDWLAEQITGWLAIIGALLMGIGLITVVVAIANYRASGDPWPWGRRD